MKTLFYSTKDFEYPFILHANQSEHDLQFTPVALSLNSADQAEGCDAVCIFTGDDASAPVLKELRSYGVKYIALRSAGYDNVDLKTASVLGFTVAYAPEYSPHAIAEHSVALMLALSRHLVTTHDQLRRNDFRLNDL